MYADAGGRHAQQDISEVDLPSSIIVLQLLCNMRYATYMLTPSLCNIQHSTSNVNIKGPASGLHNIDITSTSLKVSSLFAPPNHAQHHPVPSSLVPMLLIMIIRPEHIDKADNPHAKVMPSDILPSIRRLLRCTCTPVLQSRSNDTLQPKPRRIDRALSLQHRISFSL